MGLLDLYGSDTFTDQQKAALQQRGLLGFLAGMQKSGALDYTAPFLSGKVPGGFAAGLAGGAGGMGEAQDSGALRAMQAQELGLKAQQLRANLGLQNEELNFYRNLQGGQGGAPNAAGPSTAGPGGAQPGQTGLLPSLVKGAESEGLANQLGISPYDIGFGGADLSKAPKDENGFPIWEGKQGPAGISHAAGAYQFQPATWAQYAAPLGIKDFSQASQDKVFQAAVADKGLQPWMANPKIAALVNTGQFGGSGSSMPPQPPQQGLLAQPGAGPAPLAGGLLAQAASGQPPMPSPQPQPAPAASGGMTPGGAIPGMGMTSQQAQYLSALQSLQGRQSPDFVNKTAGLPLVGPTAAAQKWAGVEPDLYTKWHSPMDIRVNGMVLDPSTGKIVARNPAMPEGFTVGTGPNGQPIAEEVPGAIPGIAKSEQAKVGGKYQAEFGGLPGVQSGATAQSKEPIPSPRGTMIPATSEQFMPQSPSELEHAIPAWQKKTDEWNAGIAPARQAEMRLTTISDAFKLTETGAFTTHKAELSAALKALGLNPDLAFQANPAAVQEALHDNILTTLPLLKAATPRPSQIEFMSVSQNREHPNLQPAANLRMLSEDIALVRQAQQLPADWNMAQQRGWRNPQSFETAWSTLNPLDKAREQAVKDIGPLKGMPGGPGSPAAPRKGVWNPKTGAVEWQ